MAWLNTNHNACIRICIAWNHEILLFYYQDQSRGFNFLGNVFDIWLKKMRLRLTTEGNHWVFPLTSKAQDSKDLALRFYMLNNTFRGQRLWYTYQIIDKS
ncbi:hypothetical protein OS493_026174 [Desmophyllum pertusum]|uniref:Uncharacterized protein n=1 Tax=Desmophyllum pertusum TaxID=174260 RepID=A0A9X0D9V8_9CNID|nr:hypothetical protein OS493_026174 [Desmophyllum pertusum]